MSEAQSVTNLPSTPPPAASAKPANPARVVQEFAGKVMGVAMAPANFLNEVVAGATQFIAQVLPSFPAARLFADPVLGWPHAHGHPPNLIPPAPPVPLPSVGPAMCAGAVNVLINGLPAVRNGDVGFGVWCGGFFPLFEVQTGSSHVFIGGARATRMLIDFTKHCAPSTGLGKLGTAMTVVGAAIGAVGVAADLIDMSNLDDAAASAGSAAEAAADAAGASAMATGAAVQGVQSAADLASAALSAAAGKDPAIPPGIPMGNFLTGSGNVFIGGFPMPGWLAILHGLGKLLKLLKARLKPARVGTRGAYPMLPRQQPRPAPKPFFFQERPNSCLIACYRMVIASLRSIDRGEEDLRFNSANHPGGYLKNEGTVLVQNGPPLLAAYGINASASRGATLGDLQAATAAGRPAIVSIKALDAAGNEVGGHAVIVDQVQTFPDGSVVVTGRDPQFGPFQTSGADFNNRFNGSFVGTN